MFEIEGKYCRGVVFADLCEDEAISQIMTLLNQEMCKETHPRFMPDVHAGKGCVIGTTLNIKDKVVPNLVGVDIGCGMEVTPILESRIDFEKLDCLLQSGEAVPSGYNVRKSAHNLVKNCRLRELKCLDFISLNHAELSLGTLGGGNHFIEIDKDDEGKHYLVVHSGSRHLGLEVCKHYQKLAIKRLKEKTVTKAEKDNMIAEFKKAGRQNEIPKMLKELNSRKPSIPEELAYLEGEDLADYLHDMQICQEFATLNRKAMSAEIIKAMGWPVEKGFTTIHNYIETENKILRKGAVSAKKGEILIIPISMKEGAILAMGKGNPEWNYSAPHGAGRLMSRSKAKEKLSVEEFQTQMEGIYTTCVGYNTLDESPMAYKPIDAIINNIGDSVDILKIIKPVYNFKAN